MKRRVTVIDTATNTVVANVDVAGFLVTGVAINPAGTRAYAIRNRDRVQVIDTATNTVVATVGVGNFGAAGIAINPAGTRAYVNSGGGGGTLSVIDTATNTLVATVGGGGGASGIAVNPAGTRVYQAAGGSVRVFDTATNTVVATVAVGGSAYGITVTPDGTRAYVANDATGSVSVIDTATNTVVTSIPVGSNARAFGLFIGGPAAQMPPVITNGPPPTNGTVGVAYNFGYASTGCPATFSVTAGALPTGLTLSAAGVIGGTPTTVGTFTGTVRAINGMAPNATQPFSITIAAPIPPPTITGVAPNGTVGVAYSFTYTTTGSPTVSVTTGSLPPGLVLSAAGVISGTPTTAGTFPGVVTATNGTAPNATQAFSITIAAPPPTITGVAPNGTVGVAYSFTYTTTGSPTVSVTTGSLPPGLVLSAAGVISGTPTTVGTFPGVVTATNGTAPNATQAFSIVISAAGPPAAIPTLSEWGLIFLVMTLLAVGLLKMRRGRQRF